jgi:hypothetical protein
MWGNKIIGMSLILEYNDVITLPLYSDFGLITKSLTSFTEKDFCVTVKVTPFISKTLIAKKHGEVTEACIWGRPGTHIGLFAQPNTSRYIFSWFEQSDEGLKYKQVLTEEGALKEELTEITVVKNCNGKTFKLYINGLIVGESKFNTLMDYNNTPIYLGAANIQEAAYPYQGKLAAEYFYFSIHETPFYTERDSSKILVELDFNPEINTYYSVYDISNNGNRGRINHHLYDFS